MYSEIKNKHSARFYSSLLLIRRIIFVMFLISFKNIDAMMSVSIFLGLQIIYLAVIVLLRPYKSIKDNIMENINEVLFTSLIVMLCFYHKQDKWTRIAENIYIGIILFNSLIMMTVAFADLIWIVIQK